ncbi:PEP-CTERM sorting domain-containing protein, partial [bacterium]|nr:PEP-CTERM sorting domain-containing protein [bacterium]
STNGTEQVAGNPTNNSATFEVLFRPSDLLGQEVIFESGGATDGISLWLDGSLLRFDVKNGSNNARTTLDLGGIPLGFFHIIGVADLAANEARLYNFGFLAATSTTVGTVVDWAGSDNFGLGGVSGATNFGSPGGFTGDIALFRFYPWELTDAQIRANAELLTPEPGTLTLLALGGLGLLRRRRRKSRGGSKSVAAMALLAAMLMLAPASQAGLVAHWQIDEGTGTQTADATGNGHTGVLKPADTGGTGPLWVTTGLAPVPSGSAAALDFDGTEDYVGCDVDSYKGVVGTTDRSISAWVKTSSSGNQGLVSWGNNVAGQKWNFRVQNDGGTVGAIRVEVNGGYVVGSQTVADGQWHHVVAAWANDGTPDVLDTRLYVDGILQVHSGTLGEPISTVANRNVNLSRDESNRYLNGQLDEVRIYDHELTATEVHDLNGRAPAPYREAVHASDPIAYWRLDETTGTTAYNYGSIGNPANGTYATVPAGGTPATLGSPSLVLTMADTSAVAFDGTDDYINVASHGQINNGSPYAQKTTELWFRADTTAGTQVLYEQGGFSNGLNVYIDGGDLVTGIWSNNGTNTFLSTPILADTAYHVAFVFDATNDIIASYLNGVLFGSFAGSLSNLPSHIGDISVGGVTAGGTSGTRNAAGATWITGHFFQGALDEIALYNSALSALDVKQHYAASIPEPGTMTLLALGGLGLLRRRRRRA